MQQINVMLTAADITALNSAVPQSGKSADIGRRAVEIIRIYARQNGWTEQPKQAGVDLVFQTPQGVVEIEVKGTEAEGIQWGKLGVSGRPSFNNLSKGTFLYRVTDVFGQSPVVYVMKCGADFTMTQEPRWKINRK